MVYEWSNEPLSIGVADIDSGRYAYTRGLTVGRFTGVRNALLWPVSPTPIKVASF